MLKKFVSHGNSAALIIDKPILDILKVDMDTTLEITTDGKNLIILPIKNEKRSKNFKSALATINKRHETTLRRLVQ